jgi:hypothetical protein
MEQRDTVEVTALLARLAKAEQDVVDAEAKTPALAEDVRAQRRFAQGQVAALRGAEKLIREMAGWPIKERPLVDWPGGDGSAG